ncbi:MAG: SpoIIE family protein phosphatase [Ignavibacteria bacterium]|nr:SpoIIE family protein phosphatase [Ignavibacteria bacterium]
MKLRRILYLAAILVPLLIVFTIDVIRRNVDIEVGPLSLIRDLLIIGAMILVYLFFETTKASRDQSPTRKLGLILIALIVLVAIGGTVVMAGIEGFDLKGGFLLPLDYGTVFSATFLSVLLGIFSVLVMRVLRDLVLYRRRRWTRRNLLIFIALLLITAGSTIWLDPLETSYLTRILFWLAVVFAIVNSFRLSWIVYLTKREKIFGLIYGFFLFVGFITLNIILRSGIVSKSLLYYSYPLEQFVSLACIFGNIYFGMAFVSTLFHLPTAEAFDRKASEVTSLHNLSRLVTQVFDFNELVETVTSMTLQVCEAKSCWLETIHFLEEETAKVSGNKYSASGNYSVQIVGTKNISQVEIDVLMPTAERTLRDIVLEERRPIAVDDVRRDQRLKLGKKTKTRTGSLVVVPLVSHSGLIGILYATKETEFGFFKDDVEVISAFADQATVAIENSRLIKESLERERLFREMLVAQEMQRKLLPQSLPQFPTLELDATSTAAFEVGGDYYDFAQLDEQRLGIVVGDVSGKGVSAAFYMSEVKGVFQALSRMYPSPKEFLVKANEALASSFDKRSFVSLIYAVVNVTSGELTLARAGHCPMLFIAKDHVEYIRPPGMGMGLGDEAVFANAINEQSVQLNPGDVCVLYTDGITEARRGDDEFGYDRLLECARQSRGNDASAIKEHILESVKSFTDDQPTHDDLTLVVLRWQGNSATNKIDIS